MNTGRINYLLVFSWLMLCCLIQQALAADSRQVIQRSYDSSGNLIEVITQQIDSPPQIDNLTPTQFRQTQTTRLVAQGQGLLNAELSISPSQGISIQVLDSQDDELTFIITSTEQAALGEYQLRFTTLLGDSDVELTLLPALPSLALSPAPIVLAPNNQQTIQLALSSPDVFDQTIQLRVNNPDIARVEPAQVVIPAGQQQAAVTLSSLQLGQTSLTAQTDTLTLRQNIQVIVAPEVGFDQGTQLNGYGQQLGVSRLTPQNNDLRDLGPIISLLGVNKTAPEVVRERNNSLFSPIIQIAKGPIITQLAPEVLLHTPGIEQSMTITLSGQGLDNLTQVELAPLDSGLELGGLLVNGTGTEAMLPITLTGSVLSGEYRLTALAEGAPIPYLDPSQGRLVIAEPPRLTSISPVVVELTQVGELVIRGEHFQYLQSVTLEPAQGITLGIPQVNAEHTEIRVGFAVAVDAALGQRQVNVTTLAGQAQPQTLQANQLTVVNALPNLLSDFSAPSVGIRRQLVVAPVELATQAYTSALGVVSGPTVTRIQPQAIGQGSQSRLRLSGQGFNAETQVQITPDDDLMLGAVQLSEQGQRLTLELAVAADAELGARQVEVIQGDRNLPIAGSRLLLISRPQPQLLGLSPTLASRSSGQVVLSLSGEFLTPDSQLSIMPNQGLTLAVNEVAADGRSLSATLVIADEASAGDYVLQVTTAGGETSPTPSLTNRLRLVDEPLIQYPSFPAAQLGVVKLTPPSTPPVREQQHTSAVLGVSRDFVATETTATRNIFTDRIVVSRQPVATQITPQRLAVGRTLELVVAGSDLSEVVEVALDPAEDIQVLSIEQPANDQLRVELVIAEQATLGARRLRLLTESGQLDFIPASQDLIHLESATPPTVAFITPLLMFADSAFTLSIHGENLTHTSQVTLSPADGIVLADSFQVNPEGTELQIGVYLTPQASTGPRVVRLFSSAGDSGSQAQVTNTFTVLVPDLGQLSPTGVPNLAGGVFPDGISTLGPSLMGLTPRFNHLPSLLIQQARKKP